MPLNKETVPKPIEYEWFLSRSTWPINKSRTGTTALDQSGPGSNGTELVLCTPRIFRKDPLSPDAV